MNWQEKAILLVLGLLGVTGVVYFVMDCIRRYEELHAPPPIQEGLWLPPEWIATLTNLSQVISANIWSILGVTTVLALFLSVVTKLAALGTGIVNHVKCGSEWLVPGANDFGQVVGILTQCFMEKIKNILNGDCLRFYMVDMIFGLFYFIFNGIFSVVWGITGFDFAPFVTILYDLTVIPLDTVIFALSGFHITRWSESTIERCYKCTAEFAPNGDQGMKKTYSFTIQQWLKIIDCTYSEMYTGLYKIISALIPSAKWQAWANGRHQDGADDDPSMFSPFG